MRMALSFLSPLVKLILVVSLLPVNTVVAQIYYEGRFGEIAGLKPEISIAAVGDVMLGSWVIPVLADRGLDYPFQKTSRSLQAADVAIANLEAPFTTDTLAFEKRFNFKVPPEYAESLSHGGFDVVTLANNHIMDFGEGGLVETMQTLDNVGIKYSGAGINVHAAHQPTVVQVGEKKLAFFGYSMTFPTEFYASRDSSGTAYPEPELMEASLRTWENLADFTIVSFHWSAEKLAAPKDYQTYFARLAIDSGADLVLGHHPHVLQGFEVYKNRLVAYSLGNFAFGSYSSHAVESVILHVVLNEDGLFYARCLPINVDNREVEFQPHFLQGDRQKAVISKLQELSLPLNQGRQVINDSGLILGAWANFYQSWLLDVTVRTFWGTESIDAFLQKSISEITASQIQLDSQQ